MTAAKRPVRVVVVDDSPLARRLLVEILSTRADLQVVGQAEDGVEALAIIPQLEPDLVLLDMMMPSLNGIQVTATLMRRHPVRVVLVSDALSRDCALSFEALRAGALDVLKKPHLSDLGAAAARGFVRRLRALAEVPLVRKRRRALTGREIASAAPPAGRQWRLVCVGASTGGPPALRQVLCDARGLELPVLVVQHMTPGFVPGMARWLTGACGFPVHLARHGGRCQPGHAYLAADAKHLGVDGDRMLLLDDPPSKGIKPSIDFLFSSAVRAGLGHATVAIVLTGMGRDGAEGLAQIHRAGGWTIAQDEATSVVYGMPRAARETGAVREVLALDTIGRRMLTLCANGTAG